MRNKPNEALNATRTIEGTTMPLKSSDVNIDGLYRNKQHNVALYVRVSTENQLENYSIDEQTERLKAYCAAKDWNVYKIYTDGGYSGGTTDRPALRQMLSDIHMNILDIVLVYKLDRLSRSQKDTLMLIEDKFLSNGVDFASMSENFDTSTPFGRAMIGILSVFAQLEKDQITERFTLGRIGRSKAGYYHGGSTAPTGYNYTDGILVVDEYKSMQVREVFDLFLSGHSIHSIQRRMHAAYGGWSSHSLIANILRNRIYIGYVKFKNQYYTGIHKPIIPAEIFEQAQQMLNRTDQALKKSPSQKLPFRAGYLLSSILFCGKCGAGFSANHGFYKCYSRSKSDKKYILDPACRNKNWEIEKLDSIIVGEIEKLRQNSNYISNFLYTENKNIINDIGNDYKSTHERIKAIDMQISKIIDLYQIKDIPITDITSRIDTLQKEKNFLNEKITRAAKESLKPEHNSSGYLSEFHDDFMSSPLDEKRLLVASLIKSINLNDEQIQIIWRL